MQTIIRISLILSTLILCASTYAQEAPQTAKDKFVKPAISKPSDSFFKPFGRSFYISTAICAVGGIADIYTTDRALENGGLELNPLFRNNRGGLNIGLAVALKSGACGWPMLIERRHPKAAFWIRTLSGLVWGIVAARN